jgi:hypothetical protein
MSPTAAALDEVRLARLHLRVGMLPLAQAELEDLERRGELDGQARSLLAEARWRAGEAEGAATAARAHLDAGGTDPIALCIAAEAAAADGRPGEARALMDRLGPPDAATLDALFAGMPRRAFWPSGPAEAAEEATLFAELGRAREDASGAAPRATDAPAVGPASWSAGARAAPARESAIPGPKQVIEATERIWPETVAGSASPGPTAGARRGDAIQALAQDPVAELQRARAELPADPGRALLRLALTLRLDPTLAPAVLDLVAGRTEPAAALLRGDAQRLLGRHLEAEAAFASAAAGLGAKPADSRS